MADDSDKKDEDFKRSARYTYYLKNKKQIIYNNFLGGIAWSFGTFFGFAIIALVAGIIISRIDLVPIIGGWLQDILKAATTNLPSQINGK